MLSIADSIKRAKLENILNPSKTEFVITEEILQIEFQYNQESRNLRWLSAFLAELRWESKPLDFKKALKELSKAGIIRYKDSSVEVSEDGEIFFEELLKRKTILGLRSVFYHQGVINYLAMALMRTENYLWLLDVTDKACIMSLNYEELQGMIGTMISPGEEPPEIEALTTDDTEIKMKAERSAEPNADVEAEIKVETKAESEDINKEQKKSITPKFCRNCGQKLSSGSKFCKKCGTKI
jgi:ribosomal protein L40E